MFIEFLKFICKSEGLNVNGKQFQFLKIAKIKWGLIITIEIHSKLDARLWQKKKFTYSGYIFERFSHSSTEENLIKFQLDKID